MPCQFLATDPRMRHSLSISFVLIMEKKRAIVCSFLFLYKYTLFNRRPCKSLENKKKRFSGCRKYPSPRVFPLEREKSNFGLALSQTEKNQAVGTRVGLNSSISTARLDVQVLSTQEGILLKGLVQTPLHSCAEPN